MPWTTRFEGCLLTTKHLIENGFVRDDLNSRSTQVRSVFGGMGSFTDFVPLEKDWSSNEHSNNVWEAALNLKDVSQ